MIQFNMKKLISLAFLVCVLLSFIAVSAALPTDAESLVHTLDKRNKKCPCTLVTADFNKGPVKGLMTFFQDEHGRTTVTGIFSKGFDDTTAVYKYKIVDDCGNVLTDMTKGLDVQLSKDGGSKSFRHTFDTFNLNCDNSGVLNAKTEGSVPLSKRNCKKLNKRADGASATVTQNDKGYADAKMG